MIAGATIITARDMQTTVHSDSLSAQRRALAATARAFYLV